MNHSLAWKYSMLAALLMSIYGVMVCPFIDSLSNTTVATVVFVGFLGQLILLATLQKLYVDTRGIQERPRYQFRTDLASYLIVGAGLGLFNYFYFGFPLESGLKLVVGAATIGFFAATDNALYREKSELSQRIAEQKGETDEQKLFPITLKLTLFIGVIALLTAVVLILVLYKDTLYLMEQDLTQPGPIMRALFIDIAFVMLVVIALGFRVFYSFSQNLKKMFGFQIQTMAAIEQGNLDVSAPAITRDELRIIAQGTNRMISGLKEREWIKERFGKAVSPQIADRLLADQSGEPGTGQYRQVVTVFCDLRGFTALSESLPAREVVPILNQYFARMVEIIEQHGGIIDKFIGDAILAVYGLESEDHIANAEQAVTAALEMVDDAHQLYWPNGDALHNGIGIHKGRVISGILGAPGRHEFTVIGDVVNTASRMEEMCRQLDRTILISREVYESLPESRQSHFIDEGEHRLRGKQHPVQLYGKA